jgi:DNA-binding winged helix-turn-helix (wHTH) protein
VTREEILDAIWGTDFVAESNSVDRHIRSLRVKLQNDYRRPRFIATVPGVGYRFVPTFSNTGWGRAWAFVDPRLRRSRPSGATARPAVMTWWVRAVTQPRFAVLEREAEDHLRAKT